MVVVALLREGIGPKPKTLNAKRVYQNPDVKSRTVRASGLKGVDLWEWISDEHLGRLCCT